METDFSRPWGNAKHENRKEQKNTGGNTRTLPVCNWTWVKINFHDLQQFILKRWLS